DAGAQPRRPQAIYWQSGSCSRRRGWLDRGRSRNWALLRGRRAVSSVRALDRGHRAIHTLALPPPDSEPRLDMVSHNKKRWPRHLLLGSAYLPLALGVGTGELPADGDGEDASPGPPLGTNPLGLA